MICWIKGIGLFVVLIVSFAGVIAALLLVAGVIVYVSQMVLDRSPRLIRKVADVSCNAFLVLSASIVLIFFVWMAKVNVCERGFVAAYKHVWAELKSK